jgi:hypothetical protein
LASRYVVHPWRKKKGDGEVTNSAGAAKKLPGLRSTTAAEKAYKLQEPQEQSDSQTQEEEEQVKTMGGRRRTTELDYSLATYKSSTSIYLCFCHAGEKPCRGCRHRSVLHCKSFPIQGIEGAYRHGKQVQERPTCRACTPLITRGLDSPAADPMSKKARA